MNNQVENTILQVPIEDIIPNRFQPRLAFDDASLNDLASSIKQHGIIQPLVLRRKNDKYEIIAGERRYKAARMAGLVSVPAIISNLDDNASAEVAIVENVQRKDLTSIEEAKSYQALLDKGYMTQEELAKKMGLSQSAISNKLRLLTLDEAVQDAILHEKISERHARTLLKVPNHNKQKELLNKTINERLTVKQLEEEVRNIEKENEIIDKPIKNEEISMGNIKEDTITKNNVVEEMDDIPKINSEPNIDNMMNNSVDIKSIIGSSEEMENLDNLTKTITPNAFFSNPEKMPNKFFNFLEDTAANMDVEESIPTFELPSNSNNNLLDNQENIEMLDDFVIPTETNDKKILDNDYLDQVIKTIRGLDLDSDKVVVEEMNLPADYVITIKIKKDKI